MATTRPFDYGSRDYLDRLNELFNSGIPRVRATPTDPNSAPVNVSADRQMVFEDNGCMADVTATCSITFNVSCLVDGWGVFIHVLTGTATINVSTAGAAFLGGGTSKTVTAGNSAWISSNGIGFRILRMVSA